MSDNCKCGKVNFERPSDFSIGLADESKHTRLTCFNPAPESDKQAAPVSARAPKPCECGTKYPAQLKTLRVPGTFSKIIYVYFCLNGCHREGVGITVEQAAEEWNNTFPAPESVHVQTVREKFCNDSGKNAPKVSAGEVKRIEAESSQLVAELTKLYEDATGFLETIRLARNIIVEYRASEKALQSRIATLEAERDAAIREVGTTNRALGKSESELAAFKDSLPERAEKAADAVAFHVETWRTGGAPNGSNAYVENQAKAIILAEMQRKKE